MHQLKIKVLDLTFHQTIVMNPTDTQEWTNKTPKVELVVFQQSMKKILLLNVRLNVRLDIIVLMVDVDYQMMILAYLHYLNSPIAYLHYLNSPIMNPTQLSPQRDFLQGIGCLLWCLF